MQNFRSLIAIGVVAALSGCTTGNTAVPPDQKIVNPITSTQLQFSVGTANSNGTIGLNTVETLRQANGLSGVLYSIPTITGPAGFLNNGQTNTAALDFNSNRIQGSVPVTLGLTAPASTFGTAGGAFGYGFAPANSNVNSSVSFTKYSMPFYSATALPYIGGPPAFPQVRDGNSPTGFTGYAMGFTSFAVAPVAGTYILSLQIPTGFDATGNATYGTQTSSANLGNLTPLPLFTAPTFTKDGAGGGFVTVNVPAGVTEAYVLVVDATGSCYPGTQSQPVYYTLRTTTQGLQNLTLPANLGPTGPGFTNTRSICTGDTFRVYAVGFDYPANAAAYPFSTSQAPAITGSNGQADITTSASVSATY